MKNIDHIPTVKKIIEDIKNCKDDFWWISYGWQICNFSITHALRHDNDSNGYAGNDIRNKPGKVVPMYPVDDGEEAG